MAKDIFFDDIENARLTHASHLPSIETGLSRKRHLPAERALDVLGATLGMILLAPLFLLIAVALKTTSRGPVFFRQKRYGLNGQLFWIYKFRTMACDRGDSSGISQTVADDPRVTFVGRLLRKSSFDELPQLINVLSGDMSLVGPRPHVPGMLAAGVDYELFDPRYMHRHSVRPGITGLAQVRGFRGPTCTVRAAADRLEADLEYVRNHSVWLNIRIILQTIRKEFITGNGS